MKFRVIILLYIRRVIRLTISMLTLNLIQVTFKLIDLNVNVMHKKELLMRYLTSGLFYAILNQVSI